MLTPGDRRRIQRLAVRCAKLRRAIREMRLRGATRAPEADRYDAALSRLRARTPVKDESQ